MESVSVIVRCIMYIAGNRPQALDRSSENQLRRIRGIGRKKRNDSMKATYLNLGLVSVLMAGGIATQAHAKAGSAPSPVFNPSASCIETVKAAVIAADGFTNICSEQVQQDPGQCNPGSNTSGGPGCDCFVPSVAPWA